MYLPDGPVESAQLYEQAKQKLAMHKLCSLPTSWPQKCKKVSTSWSASLLRPCSECTKGSGQTVNMSGTCACQLTFLILCSTLDLDHTAATCAPGSLDGLKPPYQLPGPVTSLHAAIGMQLATVYLDENAKHTLSTMACRHGSCSLCRVCVHYVACLHVCKQSC